ncbi:hypothetical protein M0812_11793 [Anaeramoeba flamelloides]|uniref:Uncharacterized protein n=1 Tax=Anaeramoeba flamelloides TaxID=1746091 RepID=A0AAV7ZQG9_9EUKA|nr:hypothetical protein M0812_11793 [Anaeramoeba flamelloides]
MNGEELQCTKYLPESPNKLKINHTAYQIGSFSEKNLKSKGTKGTKTCEEHNTTRKKKKNFFQRHSSEGEKDISIKKPVRRKTIQKRKRFHHEKTTNVKKKDRHPRQKVSGLP